MFLRILGVFLLFSHAEPKSRPSCVTGYMTDVQNWVDEDGVLTNAIDEKDAIDLSAQLNPVAELHKKMDMFRSKPHRRVRYLSMAKCWLNRVPPVFQVADSNGRLLSQTVEYMTFFGNIFVDVDPPGENYYSSMNATDAQELGVNAPYNNKNQVTSIWSTGLQVTSFPKLRELDLRSCSIRTLTRNMFRTMTSLEALYLGENLIHFIEADAFANLISLNHLDISRNEAFDENGNQKPLEIGRNIFDKLHNLVSLDFSFTKLTQRNLVVLKGLGKNLRRLSLCNAGLTALRIGMFSGTSLRILDISNNNGVLTETGIFKGLEMSLQVVYAINVGLQNIEIFRGLRNLEVLNLANNEVTLVSQKTARTWNSLQILDLNKNRVNSWYRSTFTFMPNLRFLSLKDNNINVISEEMIRDIGHVNYFAMSGNFVVCNCHTRDFYELAAYNEKSNQNVTLNPNNSGPHPKYQFHKGFDDFNRLISNRRRLKSDCEDCADELKIDGYFVLVDYTPSNYMCMSSTLSQSVSFGEVVGCHNLRDMDYGDVMARGETKLLALLVLPCVLLPMFVLFIFRRNLRYFVITMRNSAMLSLINKNEVIDDGAIFNYDVFVSYCNEDRGWVLDHLLPHLESDCSISACLHERDFQVGLSILENIVACMDRSRSIMLIISQRFLLSQWCQFEMHLAQHRLLETRREDLTLVLLEEIPRRLRPTTLHYLMLTKTYIVWPESDTERALFWKRLRKSLVTQKLKQPEGVSIA